MISVILPIYNTEKYLKQCLDSLIFQSYKDLEIICIDDGSTDCSGKIADQYAKKDERIRVIHQKNRGESNARNVGLNLAKGEYIAFVDCDDWIEPDMYETLLKMMQDDNLDMAAGSWFKDYSKEQSIVVNEKEVCNQVFDRDQLLRYLYERDAYRGFSYMWNKLYKRDVLIENDGKMMQFDESIKLGGDVIFLAKIALNVMRARYIDKPFYHYRMREDSGSHTKDLRSFHDWIKSYEITIQLYENNNIDTLIIDYLKRFLAYHAFEAVGVAIENGDKEELIKFQNIMREYQDVYERMNVSHPNWIEQYRKRIEVRL